MGGWCAGPDRRSGRFGCRQSNGTMRDGRCSMHQHASHFLVQGNEGLFGVVLWSSGKESHAWAVSECAWFGDVDFQSGVLIAV